MILFRPSNLPDASAIDYTPADLADWDGVDPKRVKQALDRLAEGGVGGGNSTWLPAVQNVQADAGFVGTETIGYRYILSRPDALNAAWGTIAGLGGNDIVEWSGTAWVIVTDVSAATTALMTLNLNTRVVLVGGVDGWYGWDGSAADASAITFATDNAANWDTPESPPLKVNNAIDELARRMKAQEITTRSAWDDPYNYLGTAPSGTAEGDAGWTVTRIYVSALGITTITTASGAWADRATLTYA